MQCPACGYTPAEGEGDGASCPSCQVFYHKVLARQLDEAKKPVALRASQAMKRKKPAQPLWRRLIFLLFIALVVAALLAWLVMFSQTEPEPGQAAIKSQARAAVQAQLRDPGSAVFANEALGRLGAVCGQVNAKNGFGGYTGPKRYLKIPGAAPLLDGSSGLINFEEEWQRLCQ